MKERRERDGGRENRRPRRIGWSQRNSSDWWIQAIPHRVLFFSIHFRRRCPFLLLLSIIVCLFVCPYVMYVCGMWDVGVYILYSVYSVSRCLVFHSVISSQLLHYSIHWTVNIILYWVGTLEIQYTTRIYCRLCNISHTIHKIYIIYSCIYSVFCCA